MGDCTSGCGCSGGRTSTCGLSVCAAAFWIGVPVAAGIRRGEAFTALMRGTRKSFNTFSTHTPVRLVKQMTPLYVTHNSKHNAVFMFNKSMSHLQLMHYCGLKFLCETTKKLTFSHRAWLHYLSQMLCRHLTSQVYANKQQKPFIMNKYLMFSDTFSNPSC